MSIQAMVNLAVARRSRSATSSLVEDRATAPAPDDAAGGSTLSSALAAITSYIPTEVLTTYVAVVAAIETATTTSRTGQWVAFVTFVVLTPVAVWALFAAKTRSGGMGLPLGPRRWPKWEMFSATVSFAIWAYTLPGTPFDGLSWYQPAIGSVLILVSAFLFGLAAPLLQPASSVAAG